MTTTGKQTFIHLTNNRWAPVPGVAAVGTRHTPLGGGAGSTGPNTPTRASGRNTRRPARSRLSRPLAGLRTSLPRRQVSSVASAFLPSRCGSSQGQAPSRPVPARRPCGAALPELHLIPQRALRVRGPAGLASTLGPPARGRCHPGQNTNLGASVSDFLTWGPGPTQRREPAQV